MTITRQDLEDAAKAAGVELTYVAKRADEWCVRRNDFDGETPWCPKMDKADLWDLAEKCGMVIDFESGTVLYRVDQIAWCKRRFTPHNHTECAEAVILAAAEIWRSRK